MLPEESVQLFDPDDGVGASREQSATRARGARGAATLVEPPGTLFEPDDEGLVSRRVSVHSADKAHYARYYADIVGRAMKRAYPGPLAWYEPFAGPGRLWVKEEGRYRAGSPVEALDIRDPFSQYVFADLDYRCVEALRARVGSRPGVHVLHGDANSAAILDQVAALIPRSALLVLYADPEGLDYYLPTISYFAERYRHLDLLLNVPVTGAIRALCAGQATKAGLVFGHPSPHELISGPPATWGPTVREWHERQLRALGFEYFSTQVIVSHQKRTPCTT